MPTVEFKSEVFAEETGEAFILLLTIDHEAMDAPIRLNNSGEEVVSNGETYLYCPFSFSLPTKAADEPPKARIKIDNVDRRIVQAVRAITTPPDIIVYIVRASAPDEIEFEMTGFQISDVQYDAMEVTGNVTIEDLMLRAYPAGIFDPNRFPGGF